MPQLKSGANTILTNETNMTIAKVVFPLAFLFLSAPLFASPINCTIKGTVIDLTCNGQLHKKRTGSLLEQQTKWRYQYVSQHVNLGTYYVLVSDLNAGKSDKRIATHIIELYSQFAKAFPDHPYNLIG